MLGNFTVVQVCSENTWTIVEVYSGNTLDWFEVHSVRHLWIIKHLSDEYKNYLEFKN
jgi:hypothetical protein